MISLIPLPIMQDFPCSFLIVSMEFFLEIASVFNCTYNDRFIWSSGLSETFHPLQCLADFQTLMVSGRLNVSQGSYGKQLICILTYASYISILIACYCQFFFSMHLCGPRGYRLFLPTDLIALASSAEQSIQSCHLACSLFFYMPWL